MASYIIYKPYGMLSQFTKEIPSHVTLTDLDFEFESNVYPVGRLDADSEGLLILTDNKRANAALLEPKSKQGKTYWVQVEGKPTSEDLRPLQNGISITIKSRPYETKRAKVFILNHVPDLPERDPPIRFRKSVPDSWVSITITEGKNRQVKKMFAAVGFPVLRLVRVAMAGFHVGKSPLDDVLPGDVIPIDLTRLLIEIK